MYEKMYEKILLGNGRIIDLIIKVIRFIRRVLCFDLFLAFSLRKYHKKPQNLE